jgi:hypothetical protein
MTGQIILRPGYYLAQVIHREEGKSNGV